MPSSKQNISKKQIETEIYKNFEQFKKEKTIKVASYLKAFDASIFKDRKYRKIKYDYESLVKIVLYQKLKGIRFQTKLVRYLKRNPGDKYKLGFSTTPDQTTISYFINQILDENTKQLLDFTAEKIIEISEKFGILFDVNTFKPEKPKKITKDRNQRLQRNIQTKDVCRLFKKRFTPFIDLNLGKNCVYDKKTFIDLLIHLGLNQNFAESGSKIYKEYRKRCPNADTLLYHLKKYDNIQEIKKMYEILFEVVWEMARKANLFDPRKKLDVAIDFTEWFYYGSRKTSMVVAKMPERGTASCYKFITINIVDSGKRFTLLALPVSGLDDKEKLVTKLIYYAKKRIKINHVYLDRGFFGSKVINVLNAFGLKWIMPGHMNFAVKRAVKMAPAPSVLTGFRMKNCSFNLVIDKGEFVDKIVFATNMSFGENDIGLVSRLSNLYSKRWGIETSYRVKKHSFRAKTCSKNYHIRLFYFLFSVLMYNMWILADVLIWLHLFGKVEEKHLVTAKYFGTLLIAIDPGGG